MRWFPARSPSPQSPTSSRTRRTSPLSPTRLALGLAALLGCSRPAPVPVLSPPCPAPPQCPVCAPAALPTAPPNDEPTPLAGAGGAAVAPPESGTDTSLRGRHLAAFEELPSGSAVVVSFDAARLVALALGDGAAREAVSSASLARLGADVTQAERATLAFDPIDRVLALWFTGALPEPGQAATPRPEPLGEVSALRLTDDLLFAGRPGRWVLGNPLGIQRALQRIPPTPLALDGTLAAGHRAALADVDTRDALLLASGVMPAMLERVSPIVGLTHAALVVHSDLSAELSVSGSTGALATLSTTLADLAHDLDHQLDARFGAPAANAWSAGAVALWRPALSAVGRALRTAPVEGRLHLRTPPLPPALAWTLAAAVLLPVPAATAP